MGVWEFVVAYLVVFLLVQLVVYRYFRDRDGGAGITLANGPNADRGASGERTDDGEAVDRIDPLDQFDGGRPGGEGSSAEVRCPACGAANEPDGPYTYCRNCASRLPG